MNFGRSSGPVPPLDIGVLAAKGSVFLAEPTLATFTRAREDLLELADGVFQALRERAITVDIGLTAPLSEVAEVHRRMESRQTTGSTILVP